MGLGATPEMLEPRFLLLLNPDSPDTFPPLHPSWEDHEGGVNLPRLKNGERARKVPPSSTHKARRLKHG